MADCMKRRRFLKNSAAASGATLATPALAKTGAAPRKPNLVIIHCDELNFPHPRLLPRYSSPGASLHVGSGQGRSL